MRATPGLHVEWVDGEAVVLDPLSGQLHYLNPAAALVYALVQEHGYDEAIANLEADYATGTALRDGLPELLEDMKERGLLVDD